jgi:D-psicose/D-tagatose/L-ribulose 3-epimerase
MKLGVSAFAWTAKFDRSHLRLIPLVKEMGFSGFEIAMFDPADLAVDDLRRTFAASDLECTVCAILPPPH